MKTATPIDIAEIAARVRGLLLAYDEFESDDALTGLCAIGSIALAKSLARHGVSCKIVEGLWREQRHCWNLAGGQIVDITLTQFVPTAPPVFIARRSKNHIGFREWASIQHAESSTWVAECEIDWPKLIAVPSFK